jgi:PAS domain S-box-containing protein
MVSWEDELVRLKQLTADLTTIAARNIVIKAIMEDVITEAVFIHEKGVIIDCNTAAVKLYRGLSRQDLIGKNIYELMVPEQREETKQAVAENSIKIRKVAGYRIDGTIDTTYVRGITRKYNGGEIRVTVMLDPSWAQAIIEAECGNNEQRQQSSTG